MIEEVYHYELSAARINNGNHGIPKVEFIPVDVWEPNPEDQIFRTEF